MTFAPELRTHSQRVCSLYKKALRATEAYFHVRYVARYHQVLLRQRFEDNRCVSDHKEMRRLLWLGENELFTKQPGIPCMKFAKSHGGVAFERVVTPPDWIVDYWHPLEKAQYPEYFARRECRKKEFIEKWQCNEIC